MFCHITENRKSCPLESRMVGVNLINNTKIAKGLTISAELDERSYETGTRITEDQMKGIAMTRCDFHGEWNYLLSFMSRQIVMTSS